MPVSTKLPEQRPPNEKLLETLFNAALLRCFQMGEVTLYTPTSREEYEAGYDARVVGEGAFREMHLQFKAPRLTPDFGFNVYLTPHQHERLRQPIFHDSAYYIVSTFRSFKEVQLAARNAKNDPLEFRAHYVAVRVHCLPLDARAVEYKRNFHSVSAREAKDIRSRCGEKIKRVEPITDECWMSGATLVEQFTDSESRVGKFVQPGSPDGLLGTTQRFSDLVSLSDDFGGTSLVRMMERLLDE